MPGVDSLRTLYSIAQTEPKNRCGESIVDLLEDRGQAGVGEGDGVNADQALLELKTQAEVFGVPLNEIGWDDCSNRQPGKPPDHLMG